MYYLIQNTIPYIVLYTQTNHHVHHARGVTEFIIVERHQLDLHMYMYEL